MRHKYMTVDGMYGGTGLRDSVAGGYVALEELNLTPNLVSNVKGEIFLDAKKGNNLFFPDCSG